MSKKILGIVLLAIDIIGFILLAIWWGFPSPAGFDRSYITYVLVLVCVASLIVGTFLIVSIFIDEL